MTTRRTLVVKGRQGTRVTVTVEAYRGRVWMVSVDTPFISEAILEPTQVANLIDMLNQSAQEARDDKRDTTT
ncbi:MAG: hypothetical protein ACRDT0_19515 [Pseudonocardiaceae bacterium]